MAATATISVGDKKINLPVVEGSEGEIGLDISKLRSDTGAITLDPGFGNTGACESAVTFIDGDAGILRYRGIPIEQLAEKSNFVEVAYLLMFGSLPTRPINCRQIPRQAGARRRPSTSRSKSTTTRSPPTPTRWRCCRRC